MRHVIVGFVLSAMLLSVRPALAAEPPTTGNASATTSASPAVHKTPHHQVTAAKGTTPKPKAAKAKTPKSARAAHKAKKNVGQTAPRGTSATPTTSAAGSTQK